MGHSFWNCSTNVGASGPKKSIFISFTQIPQHRGFSAGRLSCDFRDTPVENGKPFGEKLVRRPKAAGPAGKTKTKKTKTTEKETTNSNLTSHPQHPELERRHRQTPDLAKKQHARTPPPHQTPVHQGAHDYGEFSDIVYRQLQRNFRSNFVIVSFPFGPGRFFPLAIYC